VGAGVTNRRQYGFGLVVAVAAMAMTVGTLSADPRYHLVVNGGPIGPGEEVTVRLVPPVSGRVNWGVSSGGGFFARPGVYHAPLRIEADHAVVTVSVSVSGPEGRFSVQSEVALRSGVVPGYLECLGANQSAPPGISDVQCDELPELIEQVPPDYPRSASARGLDDTITVTALVCATGRVIDAYARARYRDRGGDPIDQDPTLVQAATDAVRRYRFKPCLAAGSPKATWVTTVVRFPPR
jgi:hypothetical protein